MKMHLIEPNACAETTPTVLLIHPMLSSAEGMKTVLVSNMGDDLRYLVPDLAAHGEEDATEYISVSQESYVRFTLAAEAQHNPSLPWLWRFLRWSGSV